MNPLFLHPLDLAQPLVDKPFKTTLFESDRLLAGMNTLLPGQSQPIHDHPDQDKLYFVLAGTGTYTVGPDCRTCGPGDMIVAPAGIPHGVTNTGPELHSFIIVIAPWPRRRA